MVDSTQTTETIAPRAGEPPRHNVLGVGISVLSLDTAVEAVDSAVRAGRKGYVCVTDVNSLMAAQDCDEFRQILNSSYLTTPDGMPMVWMGKWNRYPEIDRVYGPDLMLGVCRQGVEQGRTHYLLGGRPGVAEQLAERLESQIPGLQIVGKCTPPFRPFTEEERQELIDEIARLRPDCIWVGLGAPKQERLMAELLPSLDTKLMFGVGAAFDFHAGLVRQAPRWMQRSGMEWFFRLCMEPRRLWRRYLVNNPRFLMLISRQLLKGRPPRGDLAAPVLAEEPLA